MQRRPLEDRDAVAAPFAPFGRSYESNGGFDAYARKKYADVDARQRRKQTRAEEKKPESPEESPSARCRAACFAGDVAAVEASLASGADPTARDSRGRNAAHWACAGVPGAAAAACLTAVVEAAAAKPDCDAEARAAFPRLPRLRPPGAVATPSERARDVRTPWWDARDFAGRAPMDLARDPAARAALAKLREGVARRAAHAGGGARPDPSRVSRVRVSEWSRRLEEAARTAAAWPRECAAEARKVAEEIVAAVEATGGGGGEGGEGGRGGGEGEGEEEGEEEGEAGGGSSKRSLLLAGLDRLRLLLGREAHARAADVFARLDAATGEAEAEARRVRFVEAPRRARGFARGFDRRLALDACEEAKKLARWCDR